MKKLLFLSAILLSGLASCSPRPVTGITLDETTLKLYVGNSKTLTATITPHNATNRNITWSSNNPAVATVTNGIVTAISAGTTFISVRTEDGNWGASSNVTVEYYISTSLDGVVINGVRWATRNVDAPGTFAQNPEDAGMFFQWNRRQGWAATGNITGWDNTRPTSTEWESQNDPCPQGWRLPTIDEFRSLQDVDNTWATRNGVNGRFLGTAPNQIFLPAAGQRASTSGHTDGGRYLAIGTPRLVGETGFFFGSTGQLIFWGRPSYLHVRYRDRRDRACGYSIRCVAK